MCIRGSNAPCFEVVWRVLVNHCICQFPLHFPSHASSCAITFQLDSTTLWYFSSPLLIVFCCIQLSFDLSWLWSPWLQGFHLIHVPFCPRNCTPVFGLVDETLLHFPSLERVERAWKDYYCLSHFAVKRRNAWIKLKLHHKQGSA